MDRASIPKNIPKKAQEGRIQVEIVYLICDSPVRVDMFGVFSLKKRQNKNPQNPV